MAGLKSLRKTRRIQLILGAFALIILTSVLVGYALRDGINLFRNPSQVAEAPPRAGEVFRIGGLVEVGTLQRGQGEEITFRVTDNAASVSVRFAGILPDLFEEGQGMIATGTMEGETFVASEILAKHDESYMPREVMDALKEQGVYKDPNAK